MQYNKTALIDYSVKCLMLQTPEQKQKLTQVLEQMLNTQTFESQAKAKKFLEKQISKQFKTYGHVWEFVGMQVETPEYNCTVFRV